MQMHRALEDTIMPYKRYKQMPVGAYMEPDCDNKKKKDFKELVLEFFADNNIAFCAVESQTFKRLVKFLSSSAAAVTIDREDLAGSILRNYASAVQTTGEEEMKCKAASTGGRMNYLSDGWENVTKTHVLGVVIALYGDSFMYGAYPTGTRHDGLAVASVRPDYVENHLNFATVAPREHPSRHEAEGMDHWSDRHGQRGAVQPCAAYPGAPLAGHCVSLLLRSPSKYSFAEYVQCRTKQTIVVAL